MKKLILTPEHARFNAELGMKTDVLRSTSFEEVCVFAKSGSSGRGFTD